MGTPFMRIMLGSNVVILLIFGINAIFRGAGNAALAMRSLWIGNIINMVLDPLLIFGWWLFPQMGVNGAAVATVIGRGCGVLYQCWHLFDGPKPRKDRRKAYHLRLGGAVEHHPRFSSRHRTVLDRLGQLGVLGAHRGWFW
jgi:Na+-driven multidrug efflux pump